VSVLDPTAGAEELVWDRWRRNADRAPDREAIIHYAAGEATHRWTWGSLIDRALEFASALAAHGVRPGDV